MQNFDELKFYITAGLNQILSSFKQVLERNKIDSIFGHQSILDYKGLKRQSLSFANIKAVNELQQAQLNKLLSLHLATIQKQYAATPFYMSEDDVIYEIANGKPSKQKELINKEQPIVVSKDLTLEEVEQQIKDLNKLKKELKKVTE